MPQDFDPAWEYRDDSGSGEEIVCDLYGTRGAGEYGLRLGRGNPDRFLPDVPPYRPADPPPRDTRATPRPRIACAACGVAFAQPEAKVTHCSAACGAAGGGIKRAAIIREKFASRVALFESLEGSGLRVHELADRVGVSQVTIDRWRRLYWRKPW